MANNTRSQIRRRVAKLQTHLQNDRSEAMSLCELYTDNNYVELAALMMAMVEGYEMLENYVASVMTKI